MPKRLPSTEAPPTSEEVRARTDAIKLATLRLCQLIADAAPAGRRREMAVQSIRTGVRLSLELIEDSMASFKDLK